MVNPEICQELHPPGSPPPPPIQGESLNKDLAKYGQIAAEKKERSTLFGHKFVHLRALNVGPRPSGSEKTPHL